MPERHPRRTRQLILYCKGSFRNEVCLSDRGSCSSTLNILVPFGLRSPSEQDGDVALVSAADDLHNETPQRPSAIMNGAFPKAKWIPPRFTHDRKPEDIEVQCHARPHGTFSKGAGRPSLQEETEGATFRDPGRCKGAMTLPFLTKTRPVGLSRGNNKTPMRQLLGPQGNAPTPNVLPIVSHPMGVVRPEPPKSKPVAPCISKSTPTVRELVIVPETPSLRAAEVHLGTHGRWPSSPRTESTGFLGSVVPATPVEAAGRSDNSSEYGCDDLHAGPRVGVSETVQTGGSERGRSSTSSLPQDARGAKLDRGNLGVRDSRGFHHGFRLGHRAGLVQQKSRVRETPGETGVRGQCLLSRRFGCEPGCHSVSFTSLMESMPILPYLTGLYVVVPKLARAITLTLP